ncbi:MAG: SOS response-associated peptidase [Eubacteriales bacterium]
MCGRYFIASEYDAPEIKKIIEQISEKFENKPELAEMKTGEIFPTDIVPVVTAETPTLMKWGFPRFDGKGQVINARLETADEKPMFRKSFAGLRCLVPATNYFEWEKIGSIKKKYAIGLHAPIYMAGLYRFDATASVPQFVILTRPAAEGLAFIHDRMPVIIPEELRLQWLTANSGAGDILSGSVEKLFFKGV